ncbi:HAL/PAL/TAL family ammonia-lyase [[Clostridium] dakarense]|uniref:HAL/PAL/TAL family ammonia-lyase n=1 Tax=Faecalimicrobium dakarense TaxID=1301100 RepID=UPI0004B36B9C|nr:aromatic amino acid ammonia-lyase [[Clostridium] dakarense]
MGIVVLGENIKIDDVVNVARYGYKVEFSKEYIDRVLKCRKLVEKFSDKEKAIYGVTTGLGDNCNKYIPIKEREIIQRNNILSHATSLGEPIDDECVRAIMFVMLQHMGQGFSGIRLETLEQMKTLLNNNITPIVPKHGSVGYLSLEAHISLVLIGEGKAKYKGEIVSGKDALNKVGLKPIVLSTKEGLTLLSGTSSVTGITSLSLYDAIVLAKTSDISAAMSLEVLKGTLMAMDDRLMQVRPHKNQINTGYNIREILKDSEIIKEYEGHRVQDALSIRCIPQLHGACKKIIQDATITLNTELNSSVDNPQIFDDGSDEGIAIMGCNADGSYVGIAADTLAIAVTNLMKMSERRTDRMLNRHVSELPAFLNKNPGLNNGLMIPQYTSAGILGEMRVLSHPATIDNVVTCANQEDYVSMGYNAALKSYECISLAKYIVAIELLCSTQAQGFYEKLSPSKATKKVCNVIRKGVDFIENDCNMYEPIEYIADLIKHNKIVDEAEEVIGKLKF